jgi:4-diphosphocytidyl-2-C-methyl-D-erythritol kinase
MLHKGMKILSPAKINLFLHVTAKRPDGYHDLVTLMCRIGLFDTIHIQTGRSQTEITCSHPEVPEDASNLAAIAANTFFRHLREKGEPLVGGVRIEIDKKIPVGAGLGGGSSNAAAVLKALNACYNSPFTLDELIQWGAAIGADVPFFLFEKPAVASGMGEKLQAYKEMKPFQVVVVFPGIHVATGVVFNKLNLRLTKCEKKLKGFLLKNQAFNIRQHLCNDLEAVTESEIPQIRTIKKMLFQYGAEGASMSGSGSSVFGLFSQRERAQSAGEAIKRAYRWDTFVAPMMV